MKEPGEDPSQGSFFQVEIGNGPQAQVEVIEGGIGDEENFVKKLNENGFYAVDDPQAMDLEEGLILAHPEVFPPGEDDSGDSCFAHRFYGWDYLLLFAVSTSFCRL
jgi:hypothetical protein